MTQILVIKANTYIDDLIFSLVRMKNVKKNRRDEKKHCTEIKHK